MNILVVDDDREIVDSIGIFLSGEGYKVLKAYDGIEALDVLSENDVHLMILDITAERWISELRQYSSSKKLSASMLNEFVKCVRVYSDNRVEIEWKHKDTIAEYIELLNGGVELAG